ncbi:hypothetical protein L326_18530 [Yersinia pestis 113]|nr:hypothetical protein L328_18625 [Yersinia pestis 24H]ERP79472.1 hypothetical protein L327_18695 [Yersinia pestis S3]ERP80536.1 hypothetical protein L326_18530 [Yersinia pestis 113]ERP84596.1 hypothetical protein L325_18615 [Yersinia pestis 9]
MFFNTPAVLDGGLDKAKLQPKNFVALSKAIQRSTDSMGVRF